MPVVACIPLSRPVGSAPRRRRGVPERLAVLALLVLATATGSLAQGAPAKAPAGPTRLLEQVWAGVQRAQQHSTNCGALTETRTSRLLTRPLVLRASFCVQAQPDSGWTTANPRR